MKLSERVSLLESQVKKLTNKPKIRVVELVKGFAPKNAHESDGGHDLKVNPTEISQEAIDTVSRYIQYLNNDVVKGTNTLTSLEPIYIDGKVLDLTDVECELRLKELLNTVSTNPVVFLKPVDNPKIYNRDKVVVGCGFKVELPKLNKDLGYTCVMLITPRSGLGVKGLQVTNSPGVIDREYRGEVKLALINHSNGYFIFTKGCRVAQGLILPCLSGSYIDYEIVDSLETTVRNEGGFGSTGVISE